MSTFEKSAQTRVKRHPERGAYDHETVYKILDEALICHVGFAVDNQPFVIPTIHARRDDTLLLHGSSAARLLKHIEAGNPICVAVTLLDGLVVARSIFNNSMNYRSVVLFGMGRLLDDPKEKYAALRDLTEHVMPGRWDDSRLPTSTELKATSIVAVPIDMASAKIRTGAPKDEPEDYALDFWAGVLPITQTIHAPQTDELLRDGIPLPQYLKDYKR